MTQQEYEKVKQECWEEYFKHVVCSTDNPKGWFERAFDRAYSLGKQGKDADSFEIGDRVRVKETNQIGTIIEPYSNDAGYRVYFDDGDGGEDAEFSAEQLELYKKTIVEPNDAEEIKAEDNVTISLHVAVIPRQEEFYMGVDASHEAYTIDIPKSMIPSDLVAVINRECKNKVVTNIAIMK